MNWYIAKIVFRICNEGSQHLQFDEHIRLIAADNFDEAEHLLREAVRIVPGNPVALY